MASRSDRIETAVRKDFIFSLFSNLIGSNRHEVGELIYIACHVPTGPTSTRQSIAVWATVDDPKRVDKSCTSMGGDRGRSSAHGHRP